MPMQVSIPVKILMFSSQWLPFGFSYGDQAPFICKFADLVSEPFGTDFSTDFICGFRTVYYISNRAVEYNSRGVSISNSSTPFQVLCARCQNPVLGLGFARGRRSGRSRYSKR